MHADEKAPQAVKFLRGAVAYFSRQGVAIKRLLTDNDCAFCSKDLAAACQGLGIRHSSRALIRRRQMARRTAQKHWPFGSNTTTGTVPIQESVAIPQCPDFLYPETAS
jgi:transposase InsO family protein